MSDMMTFPDTWQEFNSCLECRGWNLERVSIAKWCGSEFA